ncbi:MAG: stealth family protein [Oscillospiraceae bacterium]
MNDIDFVILWVDGNDLEWQSERNKYLCKVSESNTINRYRDWNNLQYWFRAVEKFTPWVRKIHFITWGHLPKWINVNHSKLNIINHKDYIPKEYLPTFNSNVIELNLHRIEDLSENFVLFNDDTFITKTVDEEFFFKNNLPCDCAVLDAMSMAGTFSYTIANDLFIINKYFQKKHCINLNKSKWFNLKYKKFLYKNIALLPWNYFTGFQNFHIPISHKKSIFQKVWDKEFSLLDNACKNKFRSKEDISHWVFRYWNLVTGDFSPRASSVTEYYELVDNFEINKIIRDIVNQKYSLICINDSVSNDIYFEKYSKEIIDAFNVILPNKSSFEI